MTQQEIDFINDLLNLKVTSNGMHSCLTMALKSARKHTGRDINTGKDGSGLINPDVFANDMYHAEYFTGLTLYLVLLEQIGGIFKKIGYKEGDKTNGIKIALDNFSKVGDDEIKVIKALRNSLVHNFGLATSKNSLSKKKEQLYKFSLNFDEKQSPIEPNLTWDGNYDDKNNKTNTNVGVMQLCQLVENVYSDLISEFKNGNIELRIKNMNEIKARFTIV